MKSHHFRRRRAGDPEPTAQVLGPDRSGKPVHATIQDLQTRTGPGVEDALTARYVVETGAAEIAATRTLSVGDRDHLRARHAKAAAADLGNYPRVDSRFHLAIAEVTGSRTLTSTFADVRMRINEYLDAIPLLERNIDHASEQHDAIVTAILDQQPDAARAAMVDHLAGTAALLRGFLS